MVELEKFNAIAKQLHTTIAALNQAAENYFQPILEQDAWLANRILTAKRAGRVLQVSISEDLASVDAFFKATGLDNEERLLQVTYPVNKIDYDMASVLFERWIVSLQSEDGLKMDFNSLLN